MNCEKIESLWARQAAEDLETPEAGALSQHLAGCAKCRARHDSLQSAMTRFDSMPKEAPSPDVWEAIQRGIEREMALPRKKVSTPRGSLGWFAPAWGLAAAAVILVLLFTTRDVPTIRLDAIEGNVRIDGRDATAGATLKPGDFVETADGARATLGFAGGTRVTLGGRSRLDIGTSDITLASGEAQFTMGAASKVEVRSRAASFMGSACRFDVTLTSEGLAEVRALDGDMIIDTPDKSVELPAGKWMTVTPGQDFPRMELAKNYESHVKSVKAAVEAATRFGKSIADGKRDGMKEYFTIVMQLTDRNEVRALATLHETLFCAALKPDASQVGPLKRILADTLEEGRAHNFPGDWLLTGDAVSGQEGKVGEARSAFIKQVSAMLQEKQRAALARIFGEDEEDDD